MSQVAETSPRTQSRLPAILVIISGIVVGVGTPLTWASIGGDVNRNYKGLDLPEGKYVLVVGILLLIIWFGITWSQWRTRRRPIGINDRELR
jgi:protein-S-isoprenylcysteine O-methyltransferase Ste14